jgi:hypothetical protein
MKTMKKKVSSKKSLMKADKGRIVKSVLKDPEDNTIKTKTNTNTGRTVTRTTFNDPGSSGITKEKRVEKIKRKDRKINEMYANNPKAAAEDDFTPIAPTVKIKIKKAMYGTSMKPTMMKKGGATKPKAMYGTSMKPSMMKKGGAKKK